MELSTERSGAGISLWRGPVTSVVLPSAGGPWKMGLGYCWSPNSTMMTKTGSVASRWSSTYCPLPTLTVLGESLAPFLRRRSMTACFCAAFLFAIAKGCAGTSPFPPLSFSEARGPESDTGGAGAAEATGAIENKAAVSAPADASASALIPERCVDILTTGSCLWVNSRKALDEAGRPAGGAPSRHTSPRPSPTEPP
ncbi:hypothetical protein BN10_730004 [Phycicoccus elongatus Lp2]|uniref:Uncharacterized protein n=1 Tax=Phycicoccus elongatus Lp2 TaxID=1193181 RepID=N0E1Y5_9MICO|nr:hypothetical protein BN10_730004 [Phycicoccus elongatus Lp2]